MGKKRITSLILGGVLGVALIAPAGAATSTFTVTTTADTVDANFGNGRCADRDGDCSLRAAIQEANASGQSYRIVLASNRTYQLDRDGGGEDEAGTGDLDVTGDIRIVGKRATVDADHLDRAFDVRPGASLTVEHLTITGGAPPETESGGAIRSAGALRVSQSRLHSNAVTGVGASGGAIMNDAGSLTVDRTTIAGNSAYRAGGGIEANAGTTVIEGSSLLSNSAGAAPGNGGGFHLTGAGTVEVDRTEVRKNTAAAEGGGLWNSATGTMTVSRTTIEGNVASGVEADQGGGGLFNDGGTLSVTRSTVDHNAADGAAGSGGGILNNGGQLSVERTNLAENSAVRAGGGIEAVAGETQLRRTSLLDNEAGPGPGNGGGLHLTGAGTVGIEHSDVRGNAATAEGGGLWNSAGGTMTVASTDVSGNRAHGVDPDQGGGGLFNDGGSLTVTGSTVSRNVADGTAGSGGGVLNNAGALTVQNSTVSNNTANRAGGGIEANAGTTVVSWSTLSRNETGPNPGNGGALHLTGAGNVDVSRSFVSNNSAAAEGGGLWNSADGTMTVSSTVVNRNKAHGDAADQGGGGVFNDGGSLTVAGSTVLWNEADGEAGSGGGLLNNGGNLRVTGSVLIQNIASRAGGGIEANVGTTVVSGSTFLANKTGANPGNGGGVHLTGAGIVEIDQSRISVNSAATEGGGLWNSATGTMTVTNTSVRGNVAPAGADALNDGGTFTIDGTPVQS